MIDPLTQAWMALAPLAAAAPAAGDAKGPNPLFQSLLFIGVMFFILYFLMIRPQRKRQRERGEMLEALKKGQEAEKS
jgi:preprotein translocase subunit YajC